MSKEKANKIKAIIKGTAPKSTFGVNPNDPWSAKSNIGESGDLDTYLKSRGINPSFVAKDSKIAHAKSGEFLKWKKDHKFEEVQSEAWDQPDYNQSIKARQAAADKAAKEQSEEGVNKLLSKYRMKNKKEHHVQEEVDKKDTVTMDIPFLIRVLELAREDVKSDMDLHRVVERLIDIRNKGTLTMDDYDFVAKLKEDLDTIQNNEFDIPVLENEEMWAIRVIDEGKMGDLAGEIGRHLDKHIDDYKANGGAEHLGYKTIDTAKKLVKSHGLHPDHAQKFVNDYVEKRLHEESLDEISQHTLHTAIHKRYQQATAAKHGSPEHAKALKSMGHMNTVALKRTQKELLHMAKHDPEAYKKSAQQAADSDRARGWSTEEVENPHLSEDTYQDPQAATQTVFDGGTNPNDCTYNRKREMSKSARIIKSIYKKKGVVKEDMYDHEKEDKSVQTYGKKPKTLKTDPESSVGENKPDAAIVMSGGTTMTGEKRDDVTIDPMMKQRPKDGQSVFNKEFGKKGQ